MRLKKWKVVSASIDGERVKRKMVGVVRSFGCRRGGRWNRRRGEGFAGGDWLSGDENEDLHRCRLGWEKVRRKRLGEDEEDERLLPFFLSIFHFVFLLKSEELWMVLFCEWMWWRVIWERDTRERVRESQYDRWGGVYWVRKREWVCERTRVRLRVRRENV